eukprot:9817808-Alexandrium_andersonii.AAC.1
MLRLESKTPGQQTWKELHEEIAEAICQHVDDKRWRAAFLALEGVKDRKKQKPAPRTTGPMDPVPLVD